MCFPNEEMSQKKFIIDLFQEQCLRKQIEVIVFFKVQK